MLSKQDDNMQLVVLLSFKFQKYGVINYEVLYYCEF